MSNPTINADLFAITDAASVIAKASTFGTNEGEHGDGFFRIAMLAVNVGAAKLNVTPIAIFTAYAKAKNAVPMARKIDLNNANVVKNKVSVLKRFVDAGTMYGAKSMDYIGQIVVKLDSFDVDAIRSALVKTMAEKKFTTKGIERVADAGSKSTSKKVTEPVTFEASVKAIVALAKAGQTALPANAAFFAGLIKYIEATSNAEPVKPVPAKKTATAPRRVAKVI